MFAKAAGYEAGADGQNFDDVLEAITLTAEPPKAVAEANRVLILDDIFNMGNTAGAMITHVRLSMATQPQVVVACVLYVPLEPKVDWEAHLKEVTSAPKDGVEDEADAKY